MADTEYLFIDGGYVREVYSRHMKDFFGVDGEIDFAAVRGGTRALRVFYYDCLDDIQKSGEVDGQYQARLRKQEGIFSEIQSLPGYHVRLGSLSGKGTKTRQKEVDVLLAVDMLTHSHQKNMSRATLLSGDLDFKPVVECLVRQGTYIVVVFERRSAAADLYGSADWGRELRFHDIYHWSKKEFTAAHPIPTGTGGSAAPEGLRVLRRGRAGDRPITLYSRPDGFVLFADRHGDQNSLTYSFGDAEKLEKFYSLMFDPVTWE